MLASLLLLASHTLLAPPAGNISTADPPIRVWFNSDGNYGYADRAKVYAKSAEDGYLIVLRAEADGRVRVLFPLDPQDDQRIVGGKKYELKGRGGREAFIAGDTAGHGTVLAAIASSPFQVDRFARDGHWDTRALSGQQGREDDAETVLRELVEQMKPAAQFEYAVATYVVSERYSRARYDDPYGGAWFYYDPWWGYRRAGIGVGYRRWHRPWYW